MDVPLQAYPIRRVGDGCRGGRRMERRLERRPRKGRVIRKLPKQGRSPAKPRRLDPSRQTYPGLDRFRCDARKPPRVWTGFAGARNKASVSHRQNPCLRSGDNGKRSRILLKTGPNPKRIRRLPFKPVQTLGSLKAGAQTPTNPGGFGDDFRAPVANLPRFGNGFAAVLHGTPHRSQQNRRSITIESLVCSPCPSKPLPNRGSFTAQTGKPSPNPRRLHGGPAPDRTTPPAAPMPAARRRSRTP